MAAVEDANMDLMNLEEELTCSICLSTFECPVTIPCGHNFCHNCLFTSWTDSSLTYSCPQCRTEFPTKPELRKNTVLCTVVETFNLKSTGSQLNLYEEESKEEVQEVEEKEEETIIRCDTCMLAEACRTCLTCMASFCEEHLRPHKENPIFRPHQLTEPVGDLLERICTDHHKLMELFCTQHNTPVCSFCLQQNHKGCSFTSPEEQRMLKESDLRAKLDLLDVKIMKNEACISQMTEIQDTLKEAADSKKNALTAAYEQLHDMLTQEENAALQAVDAEMHNGQIKLKTLMKKFSQNVTNMNKAKKSIHSLLSRTQTLDFLQVSCELPAAVKFEPYSPRINLNSSTVMAYQAFPAALKESLTEVFKQPVESRQLLLRQGGQGGGDKSEQSRPPHSHSPAPDAQPKAAGTKKKKPQTMSHQRLKSSKQLQVAHRKSDGTVLTFDPKTVHKRITLTEQFTKATVSEEMANYPNYIQRFTVCSQVLASKAFSKGRHYWEIRLSCNNFIGLGLALGSIDRKGPNSRLGRNAQSWCVEWFNVKLSAWHNSMEVVLQNPSPKRVGVLLDCDAGKATFYKVAEMAYPFFTFDIPITEAVYPAFWLFSSSSSLSLCKLQQ
uniref:Tripartite motif containing 25 n=1 Tax=Cynoglossus semilaevis TaxID=244447 RepID=A0A3P8WFR8_CYNSE